MEIRSNAIYANNSPSRAQTSFKGAPEKLINKILTTPEGHLRKLAILFDDALGIYFKMGFQTFLKQGSHASVLSPDGQNFQLVIPHGREKSIAPMDIKRLKSFIEKYKN